MRHLHNIHDSHAPRALFTHLRRLKREYSRASRSTVTPHSHHQLSIAIMSSHPLHPLDELLSLEYRFAHFRFARRNVPALRAPMSPCSRAIDTSPSHHCSHHHHIPELLLCLHAPESPSCNHYSTALSCPYGTLCTRFPAPFAFFAHYGYASLASSQSLQPRLHYACSSPYILIATSLVHHMMH
jgi:hypothetical protein